MNLIKTNIDIIGAVTQSISARSWFARYDSKSSKLLTFQ